LAAFGFGESDLGILIFMFNKVIASKLQKYRPSRQEIEYHESRTRISESEQSKEGSACSNRPRYAAAVRVPHHSLAFDIASATPLLSA
jgi:hypothetical protein